MWTRITLITLYKIDSSVTYSVILNINAGWINKILSELLLHICWSFARCLYPITTNNVILSNFGGNMCTLEQYFCCGKCLQPDCFQSVEKTNWINLIAQNQLSSTSHDINIIKLLFKLFRFIFAIHPLFLKLHQIFLRRYDDARSASRRGMRRQSEYTRDVGVKCVGRIWEKNSEKIRNNFSENNILMLIKFTGIYYFSLISGASCFVRYYAFPGSNYFGPHDSFR
jgi:hypothetical protein